MTLVILGHCGVGRRPLLSVDTRAELSNLEADLIPITPGSLRPNFLAAALSGASFARGQLQFSSEVLRRDPAALDVLD